MSNFGRRAVVCLLLGGFILSASVRASLHDDDEGGDSVQLNADFETCERRVAQVGRETDIDALAECIDWYWHNGGADIGFNKILKLGYRIIDLDARQTEMYTTMAWLLWSKWVTWKNDPANMPDGEKKVEEAVALLTRGRAANRTDAAFHLDCGQTLMPLAQIYRPDVWPFVVGSFELADRYAAPQDSRTRLMARMGMAHSFRYQKQWEKALENYLRAMQVTPDYRPALMNAGLSAGKLHRFDEALGYYDRVLLQLPNSPSAWNGKGDVYADMVGRKADATAAYLRALAADPKNLDSASGLRKVGAYAEASQVYESILRDKPNDVPALLGRAHVFRETGNKPLAIVAYEAVLQVDPKNAEAIWYLEELKKPFGLDIDPYPGSPAAKAGEEEPEFSLEPASNMRTKPGGQKRRLPRSFRKVLDRASRRASENQ